MLDMSSFGLPRALVVGAHATWLRRAWSRKACVARRQPLVGGVSVVRLLLIHAGRGLVTLTPGQNVLRDRHHLAVLVGDANIGEAAGPVGVHARDPVVDRNRVAE